MGRQFSGVGRRQKEIAGEILGYFARNPKAVDDLEGIARWRLLEEVVHRTLDETRGALQWLVKQGVLLETSTKGGGPVFRLNAQKKSRSSLDAT